MLAEGAGTAAVLRVKGAGRPGVEVAGAAETACPPGDEGGAAAVCALDGRPAGGAGGVLAGGAGVDDVL